MIVYVESNFVLEYALFQDQYDSCSEMISLAEAGQVRLVVPAFCIAETFEALYRRKSERTRLNAALKEQLALLARTRQYHDSAVAYLADVENLFLDSAESEADRLHEAFTRILSVGEVIPLALGVLSAAIGLRSRLSLEPPDSVVLASVLQHLAVAAPEPRCFLNRDAKGFRAREIREMLSEFGCTLFLSFDGGRDFILSRLRS